MIPYSTKERKEKKIKMSSNLVMKIKVGDILKERNITQKDLSVLTGINRNQIQRICSNQHTSINKKHLAMIANALDIEDLNDLFEITTEDENNVSRETRKDA